MGRAPAHAATIRRRVCARCRFGGRGAGWWALLERPVDARRPAAAWALAVAPEEQRSRQAAPRHQRHGHPHGQHEPAVADADDRLAPRGSCGIVTPLRPVPPVRQRRLATIATSGWSAGQQRTASRHRTHRPDRVQRPRCETAAATVDRRVRADEVRGVGAMLMRVRAHDLRRGAQA